MRIGNEILAIDIGTGTQDIILLDSLLDVENSFKMVLPSPTMILRKKVQAATRAGKALFLWSDHGWRSLLLGDRGSPEKRVEGCALPQAARTINDDLDVIRELGVKIISPEETARLDPSIEKLTLGDVDLSSIIKAFSEFGVSLDSLDLLAVGVFDHGMRQQDIRIENSDSNTWKSRCAA